MSSDGSTISVLFVCLGNICRSPLAEGVFRDRVERRGLDHRYRVDSAGTGAWHVGEPPDRRSAEVAKRHGIALEGRARRIEPDDLTRFDWVVAMDRSNLEAIESLRDAHGGDAELALLRDFDEEGEGDEVPDPYYGGHDGFDRVFDLVARSIDGFLDHLEGEGETARSDGPSGSVDG